MAYSKTHDPWLSTDLLTIAALNNIETQFDESYSYFIAHGHTDRYYTKTEMDGMFWNADNDGSGSGSDADMLYSQWGNLHLADFLGMGVIPGQIIMYAGETAPEGWTLCNGENGTPDLGAVLVLGAGDLYSPGANGNGLHTPTGSISVANHVLTAEEIKGHQHTYTDYAGRGNSEASGYISSGDRQLSYAGAVVASTRETGNSSIGQSTPDGHKHTATFTGEEFLALPPYRAVTFIMKLE